MSYPVSELGGVDQSVADKLKKAGIRTSAKLLERAKDPKGRKSLSAATGVPESAILDFANLADLMRLRGVANEYAELLAAVGVDTVRDLRNRNPSNLFKAIAQANGKAPRVRLLPSERMVAKWIAEAKTLPPVMTY